MRTEKKWLFALVSGAFITFLNFLFFSSGLTPSHFHVFSSSIHRGPGYPPAFAYFISGGSGDGERVFRLMLAVYHPRNRYLLHISADGSDDERERLAALVRSVPVVRAFGNVDVFGKPDPNTQMGSTNLAAVLRAAAVLLKVDGGWDWFVTLSASDYPLLTQDDLSYVFASVGRDINFIDHTSDLGWKVGQRIEPVVVDPAIYLARKSNKIFHATETRPIPTSFKVFTGSPWFFLSRSFLEFCIFGWDNLPRTLLMYSTNIALPQEVYFHSVICNAPQFKNTTVNADLRFFTWDKPPKMEPRFLTTSDYRKMVESGAAFARQFKKNEPVLDIIDQMILSRSHNRATPGAWCSRQKSWFMDPCSEWGDVNVVKPGPCAKKFGELLNQSLADWSLQLDTCT